MVKFNNYILLLAESRNESQNFLLTTIHIKLNLSYLAQIVILTGLTILLEISAVLMCVHCR